MTRKEAIEIINNTSFFAPSMSEVDEALNMAIESLSIDVVRCKDCKYGEFTYNAPPECRWFCKNSINCHSGSFFCSLGERKEEWTEQ